MCSFFDQQFTFFLLLDALWQKKIFCRLRHISLCFWLCFWCLVAWLFGCEMWCYEAFSVSVLVGAGWVSVHGQLERRDRVCLRQRHQLPPLLTGSNGKIDSDQLGLIRRANGMDSHCWIEVIILASTHFGYRYRLLVITASPICLFHFDFHSFFGFVCTPQTRKTVTAIAKLSCYICNWSELSYC